MTSESKVEQSKTKNEEIASLIEQQVQDVVDPFASTFNALWGTSLLSGTQKSLSGSGNVQENTCTNLYTDEVSSDSPGNQPLQTLQDENEELSFETNNVQNKTGLNLNMDKNEHRRPTLKKQIPQKNIRTNKHSSITFNPLSQKILKIINQVNNFALIGFITLLNIIYPKGEGTYSINGLARITGMSRTSIRGNLQNLESLGLIQLREDEIFLSQGCRDWLHSNASDKNVHVQIETCSNIDMFDEVHGQIKRQGENSVIDVVDAPPCPNSDMYKNRLMAVSSSCNNITTTTTEDDQSKNDCLNLDMNKFRQLPSWEKAKIYSYADDLFYLAIVTKIQIETLSIQTLSLYERILQEHNREYAAALFLLLLPKAKDNLTGYITSAYRQGAVPTTGTILKIKEIFEASEIFSKNLSIPVMKEQIQTALEKDDAETIMRLTQIQLKIKGALKLLSWPGTIEELKGKHDSFVEALLVR